VSRADACRLGWRGTAVTLVAILTAPAQRATCQSVDARPLVIRGGTLIDGTGRPAVTDVVVVVRGARIECVGQAGDCPTDGDVRVIDARGRFLVPGLIDTHVHLHWATDSAGSRQVQELRFAYGITTVREAGTSGQLEANLARRAAAAEGGRPTPRIFVSGVLVPGGTPGTDAPPAQVRRLAALGVNAIKLKDPLTLAEMAAVAVAAREVGLPVFGHVWTGEAPDFTPPVAPEVYDGVSHMYSIAPAAIRDPASLPPVPDDSASLDVRRLWNKGLWLAADHAMLEQRIQALVQRHTWLEPLLVNEEHFAHSHETDDEDVPFTNFASVHRRLNEIRIPERSLEQRAQALDIVRHTRSFVKAFHDAGGMLVTGTDNAPIPGISLHQELQTLVSSGLTASEALAAATRNAAIALRAEDSLGTIEPGKVADVVILAGDPLADIGHTRHIWRVVKAGVVHRPDLLLQSLRGEGLNVAPASPKSKWPRRQVALVVLVSGLIVTAGLVQLRRRRG